MKLYKIVLMCALGTNLSVAVSLFLQGCEFFAAMVLTLTIFAVLLYRRFNSWVG